jgi:hypothetical protein
MHTLTRLLAGIGVLALGALAVTALGTPYAHGQAPGRATPMKPHTGPLPPLPVVAYAPARPMPIVKQVYEFAARHPEVLHYVPCYCGCERLGHSGNHDCFVRTRAASGRVSEWDPHGVGCTVCLDVAREAMTLFETGSTPADIRAAIDRKYRSRFPSSTPTPRPR